MCKSFSRHGIDYLFTLLLITKALGSDFSNILIGVNSLIWVFLVADAQVGNIWLPTRMEKCQFSCNNSHKYVRARHLAGCVHVHHLIQFPLYSCRLPALVYFTGETWISHSWFWFKPVNVNAFCFFPPLLPFLFLFFQHFFFFVFPTPFPFTLSLPFPPWMFTISFSLILSVFWYSN